MSNTKNCTLIYERLILSGIQIQISMVFQFHQKRHQKLERKKGFPKNGSILVTKMERN